MIEEDIRELDRRLDRLSEDVERLERKVTAVLKKVGCPVDHSKLSCYEHGDHSFKTGSKCDHCGRKEKR